MANYDANASKIKVVRAMLAIEYSLYKENLERIPSFCPNMCTYSPEELRLGIGWSSRSDCKMHLQLSDKHVFSSQFCQPES